MGSWGEVGPPGIPGDQGPKGPGGPQGVAGYPVSCKCVFDQLHVVVSGGVHTKAFIWKCFHYSTEEKSKRAQLLFCSINVSISNQASITAID